ncbi:hypothetical protein WJX73_002661 [Symbiochloris irregularis]|uniref:catalase n=1 Tax=Symbiochloris irregularis TaxID=706552 RepID=A0AAW1NX45_9CHLO
MVDGPVASSVGPGIRPGHGQGILTTNGGVPIYDNLNSETVGSRGPVLLEDFHLQEKNAVFNRAKLPERTVHARGFAAKGHFEVTKDISALCAADLFSEVGKKTPVAARFSTVVHERGSPESLRDIRGFSVKFYTQAGNWDFVGNDTPTFFVRDGLQFADLNRALRPDPVYNIQQGWRVLDFNSHHPESILQFLWLLGDRGIPKSWRFMEGYGIHTFVLAAKDGKQTYVKFKWEPKAGVKCLSDDEAQKVGEANMRHSHASADCAEAIDNGEPLEWTLYIQTMDPATENDWPFDPLDSTKVWDEAEFPLQEVGRMVLDKNVDNWHNENEMIAFSPGMLPPGILPSNDKLLHSRIMAYSDAQRYRLGVNYLQLPINAPKNTHFDGNYDGLMNTAKRNEEVNYEPSHNAPVPDLKELGREDAGNIMLENAGNKENVKTRQKIGKDDYTFVQSRKYYQQMERREQEVFQGHLVGFLAMPKCHEKTREIWVGWMHKVDETLGQEVEKALNDALSKSK